MEVPSQSRKEWLGDLTERYRAALTPEVLSYLGSRGLGSESVSDARLGLVVDPDPVHEKYRGWLSLPYITPTGVVYMRFRCLEDHDHEGHGKYEGPVGEETHLYNVAGLHGGGDMVAVCEGELDTLTLIDAGIPAVGVPGATAFKSFYTRLFEDFPKVLVVGDGDLAGRRFASEVAGKIANGFARPMPEGEDVNSYYVQRGKDRLVAYLNATLTR